MLFLPAFFIRFHNDSFSLLRYGQYSVSENVSPYIPLNPYTESFLPTQNSYQTPANSYEPPPKPMPASFSVYTATNPAPVQYKPAKPIYTTQPSPVNYAPPNSYTPVAPLQTTNYATNNYAAAAPPPPSQPAYATGLPAYTSYAAPPTSPIYLPKPDIIYGLNYEQNQKPVFVPTASYPTSVSSYPASIPYYHQPMIPSSVYKPYVIPVISNYDLPVASKANDTEKASEPKKEETPVPADPKIVSTPIINESPAVKPPPTAESQSAVEKVPAPQTPVQVKPASSPAPPAPPAPQTPVASKPAKPVEATKLVTKANYTKKFTGYRYVNRRKSQQLDRRSIPAMYNQAPARIANHPSSLAYRSASAPYLAPPANPNPYPPSSLNYANKTAPAVDYYKRSHSGPNQYKTVAKETKHSSPTNLNSRGVSYASNNAYNNQKAYYPQASTATYQQQTSVYNENNVAEVVLRGYSVNAEDNNNKAVVRVFEEVGLIVF